MNCKDVRENLIELLAEGSADAAVTAHVKDCGSCAQELESMRKTMALLDEWEPAEASPYFLTRLQAHVREERNKAPAGWLAWVRRPVMAVSLAAVLAGGAVVYQISNGRSIVGPAPVGTAVSDLEALERNHDLYVNSDLIDELTGGPSADISED
ncbi:MAG TPA: hypothetical protein VNV88_11445 [Candidatus Solibacter sp.]|nr:hypothetical protein [Candidatus Solibacter sp.]